MNERIKELADYAYSYASEQAGEFTPEFMGYYDKKFAELLIRECAKIVTIWSNEEPCSEGYDITPVFKMKEHFGFKE